MTSVSLHVTVHLRAEIPYEMRPSKLRTDSSTNRRWRFVIFRQKSHRG